MLLYMILIDIVFQNLGDDTNAQIDFIKRLSDFRLVFTGEQSTSLKNAINDLRATIQSLIDEQSILRYDM